MLKYRKIADNELILRARAGETSAEDALASRYLHVVYAYAHAHRDLISSIDREDIIQEVLIGLIESIRLFDPMMEVSFKTFAMQCIRNRMISAIKSASRLKHTPLNKSVSFDYLDESSNTLQSAYYDSFSRRTEEQVLAREREEEILIDNSKHLSQFERDVLDVYLRGMSCKEIAERMDCPEKSINNAVQRIRKKVMRDE